MTLRLAFATLLCMLSVPGSAVGFTANDGSRQAVALWLSQQLHQPVKASQVLVAPNAAPNASGFDGCSITRVRNTPIGATALSLHCPAPALPQLVLLNFSVTMARPQGSSSPASRHVSPRAPSIVHSGAALNADWRTDFIHAQLPVVALDSGAAGAEIRVRIARTNRTMRARILSAHTVTIINPGT